MDKVKANTFMNLSYWARKSPVFRKVKLAAPTDTLTNFPVLIKANPTFNIGTSTGYDVHFQDISGNELAFELDFYDPVAKTGAWWVRIPILASSGITSIKMLYGDSSASTNGSSPSTVWADYKWVYHFSGADPLKDSLGNADVTLDSGLTSSVVSGMVTGSGLQISSSGVKYVHYGAYVNSNAFTYTLVAHATEMFCHSLITNYYSYGFNGYSSPFYIQGAGLKFYPTITFPSMEYLSFSGGPDHAFLLFNGTSYDCSASEQPGWLRDDGHCIQLRPSCVYTLDEFRISNTVQKPDAWLVYEQAQITDHSTYTTYGPEIKQ